MAHIPNEFLAQLRNVLNPDQILTEKADIKKYAKDLWTRGLVELAIEKEPRSCPDLVVFPTSTAQIQTIVSLCKRFHISITPFGAGSGVCGAAASSGGLVLNLIRMNQILQVDKSRSQVTCQPGVLGSTLEKALQEQGLTLGHFPSSIICSTVAGWAATRSAGQCSTRYGKIEDLIQEIEWVSADGERYELAYDAKGPDLMQLLIGSEGTLGILTKITLRLRPLPQSQRLSGWTLNTVQSGTEAIAALMQAGLRPSIVRLYDELDSFFAMSPRLFSSKETKKAVETSRFEQDLQTVMSRLTPAPQVPISMMHRWMWKCLFRYPNIISWINKLLSFVISKSNQQTLLILGFEGDPKRTELEEQAAEKILFSYGAKNVGSKPAERWLAHRYELGFKLPKIFAYGALVDTMEVATTWQNLIPVYKSVQKSLASTALVLAHFSHAYEEGCSIYFTFLCPRKTALLSSASDERKEDFLTEDMRRYDQMWNLSMNAAIANGATISHHHGIGILKSPFLAQEHGQSLDFLHLLKHGLDQDQLLNPGKLGLDQDPNITIRQVKSPAIAQNNPEKDLFFSVDANLSLLQVETSLQKQSLTLGPLPSFSYQRSVKEALQTPFASEASPGLGTFRDRCLQLTIDSKTHQGMVFPTHLSPKRASGPDLKALFLGMNDSFGHIQKATLRVVRMKEARLDTAWRFQTSEAAFSALFQIFDFFDALGPNEIQVVSQASFAELLPSSDQNETLLVLRFTGISTIVHGESEKTKAICQALGGIQVDGTIATRFLSPWIYLQTIDPKASPKHETFLLSPSKKMLVDAWHTDRGPQTLCGIHLHGMTLSRQDTKSADVRPKENNFLRQLLRIKI